MDNKKINKIKINMYGVSDDAENIDLSQVIFTKIIVVDTERNYQNPNHWITPLLKRVAPTQSFDITKYKTFYRYPNLSLSRDKMDLVKKKYGVRKVLNPDKADFRIISEKTVNKLSEYSWRASLSSMQFLQSLVTDHPDAFSEELLSKLTALAEHSTDRDLIIECDQTYGGDFDNKAIQKVYDLVRKLEGTCLTYVPEKNHDAYLSMFDQGAVYIDDVYMNELCGEDSIPLDAEAYKNIRTMLTTGTKEDKTVAMTMMANCNVAKSKTYLALLFFHYTDTLRNGPCWNQVAFKTLRKTFEKYELDYNRGHAAQYSKCMEFLAEDDALTVEAAQHLINLVFKHVINGNSGINEERSVFRLSRRSIKLTNEVKAKIKAGSTLSEEYKIQHTDDLPF